MPGWDYDVSQLRGRPIGRVLVKMEKTTREKVQEALAIQKEKSGPLGQILVDLGHIDEITLNFALAFQAGMAYVDLDKLELPPELIKLVPAQMVTTYKILPVEFDEAERKLVIAVGSPDNFRAVD